MNDTIFGIIIMVIGIVSTIAAIEDWDWFMDSRKAKGLSNLIGRNGARVFYGIFGVVLLLIGMAGLFSFISWDF